MKPLFDEVTIGSMELCVKAKRFATYGGSKKVGVKSIFHTVVSARPALSEPEADISCF